MCHIISHLNDLEGDKIRGGGWVSKFMANCRRVGGVNGWRKDELCKIAIKKKAKNLAKC